MVTLEQLREELHKIMKAKDASKELKLLNVGSDNHLEHHWRFKNAEGQIFTISVWQGDNW